MQHVPQGFLHQVFRKRSISPCQPIEIAKQGSMMARHQGGECHLIACYHGCQYLFVAALMQSGGESKRVSSGNDGNTKNVGRSGVRNIHDGAVVDEC